MDSWTGIEALSHRTELNHPESSAICTMLHYTLLCYTRLYYTLLFFSMLYYTLNYLLCCMTPMESILRFIARTCKEVGSGSLRYTETP